MGRDWPTTRLDSEDTVLRTLIELQGQQWLFRGQSRTYGCLVPSIDRDSLQNIDRLQKLERERQSINVFRANAHYFANLEEQVALADDITTLMVLRHYG